jgi:hypothetical protein
MHSRRCTLVAVVFAILIAVSASAAPDRRSDSGVWLGRQLTRIVKQLKKVFVSPFDELQPIPPHP